MNILNIHGYAGKAENTNYTILHEAGYNVTGFTIDYDSCSAIDVEEFLTAAVKAYNIDLVVATSYGSYFANILSAKFDIPFIATNPCVYPSESLLNISPDYCKREIPYYRLRNDAYVKNWENGIFILGDNDEVLDHTITKKMIGKAKTYTVSGGHRLNKEVYEKYLLEEVRKVAPNL